jgi:hypothetical protein
VLHECLAVVLAWHGGPVSTLNAEVLQQFQQQLQDTPTVPASSLRPYRARLSSLRQLLFQLGVLDAPDRRRPWARTLEQRFDQVEMPPAIRATLLRYVNTRAAVLRPKSVESLVNDLLPFAEYLTAHHRDVTSLRHLQRHHVEAFLGWNKTRPWRGRRSRPQAIGPAVAQSTVLTLRNMLEDIAAWGWADAPTRRLVFAADIPKLDRALPRALPPDVDAALMTSVANLADPFARTGLQVLRPSGNVRGRRPTDFLFTEHGHRLGATRLRNGLLAAVAAAGLRDAGGRALIVTPQRMPKRDSGQVRPIAVNGQARHERIHGRLLIRLSATHTGWPIEEADHPHIRHRTPEMTLRYATLASPTLRGAYDQAVGTMRRQLTLTPVGKPIVPDKVAWLASEMLKTRVAHGYCSRHPAQGPCPYANICETCDSYTPATEFAPVLADQLSDIQALHADAQARGWDSESQRHQRVAEALQAHLDRLQAR